MSRISFDDCVIEVGERPKATALYRDVQGAEIVPYGIGAMFRFGPMQINIHGPDQIGKPRATRHVMPDGSDLRFEWHDTIEEAAAHLGAHGVLVEEGPFPCVGASGC